MFVECSTKFAFDTCYIRNRLGCWQSVFLSKFSRDYEDRLFSLQENGTRHRLLPYSAILPYRSFAFVMPGS